MNALINGMNRLFDHARHGFARRNAPEWTGHTQFLAESEDGADLERRLDLVQQHPAGVPLALLIGAR